MVAIAGIVM